MKVCAMQLEIALGNREANFGKVRSLFASAMADKPDVIVMPELWDVGFYPDNVRELADVDGRQAKELLQDLARRHDVNIVGGSVAELRQGKVRNTNFVIDRQGQILHEYSKTHLFSPAGEHQHFAAGDLTGIYRLDGIIAASIICYDVRFPELTRKLALEGCQVLFVPAAWPHPRLEHWQILPRARAIENQMYVVAVNGVGTQGSLTFCGHSTIVGPWGDTVGTLGEEEGLLYGSLDLAVVDDIRRRINVFHDRRPELYGL